MTGTNAEQTPRSVEANPMDNAMTPAQVARRKFKSGLPRKPQTRSLSICGALGETFTLLDTFRRLAPNPDETISAALAFYRSSDRARFAEYLAVPRVARFGEFCEAVTSLRSDTPSFLGVVFIQADLDTNNPELRAVSFAVPFMSGIEPAARLRTAQHGFLAAHYEFLHSLKK